VTALARGRRAAARLGLALALALAAAGAARAEPFRPLGAEPATPPAVRVYLLRHAQAWKNVPAAQRPPGLDAAGLDALTERGRAQAEAAGRRLAGAGVTRVVCSPARRARQTAEAIAGVLGTGAVEVSERFAPLAHGPSPQAADFRWRTGNWRAGRDPRPDGGESLGDGLARAAGFLEEIAAAAPGTTLVVVTHGEIAAALLSRAEGISPLAGYEKNFVGEGTISDLGVSAGRWELYAKGVRP
jgi:probable phosphoglycerate mutase